MQKKCVVQGCKNYNGQGMFKGEFCLPCYNFLKSGIIGQTSSFLKCIPAMRMKLISIKDVLESPYINNATRLKQLEKLLKDVEGDE